MISISSPIARALMGKREGDVVEVRVPKGTIEYSVTEVAYK
jgi:transcription elongation factor GreA